MLHPVEIEFLFLYFELLRLERQQILLDFDLPQIDLWHELHSRKAVLKASGTSFSGREAAELATWECKQQISVGGRKSCRVNMTVQLSF